jgi:hypothetical protein
MGRRFRRVRSLNAHQWRIVARAAVLVPLVKVRLRRGGFGTTLERLARSATAAIDETITPDEAVAIGRETALAVGLVAHRPIVGDQCLGRSLVTWSLLRREGIDSTLVVGAEPPAGDVLSAHAWVEVAGVPVNERADVRKRFGSFELVNPSPVGDR